MARGPRSRYQRSGSERFELYTRLSLYLLSLLEPMLVTIWLLSAPSSPGDGVFWAVAAGGVLHTALCLGLLRTGLRQGASHRTWDWPWVASAVTTSLAAAVGVLTLHSYGAFDGSGPAEPLAAGAIVFLAGPLMIAWPVKESLALLLGLAVCAVTVANGLHVPRGFVVNVGLDILVGGMAFGMAYRFSAWALGVVRELRRSREIQAQLAVAEERLRFARDLHDVLGRNLTVIALKSELAAALTQRGEPSARAQMAEVQRIARDSQDEMRAVIRGYRSMDLHIELKGARSVLQAAGIDCRIESGVESQANLDQDTQMALGWAVREGITNVLRHSEAKLCKIEVSSQRDTVTLTVENDGVCRARAAIPEIGGIGLIGLRERLDALGGTLETVSKNNGLFSLSVHLPKTPDTTDAQAPCGPREWAS